MSGHDVVPGRLLSVNTGRERPIAAKDGTTGIDKRPVSGPVAVRAPGPKGTGGSGFSIPLIDYRAGDPVWLSGGRFGPEGGLLSTGAITGALLIMVRWARQDPS